MARRWPAAAVALLLAIGCTSTSGETGADDPPAEPPGGAADAPAASTAGYERSAELGRITDPAVGESSGLAASRRNPGLLWTHNDSDDGAFLYCLDLKARSCGAWQATGAKAFDWEDIAAGPGPRANEPYLYVGDIGDNIDQRTQIVVYRIPEPAAGGGGPLPTKAQPAATAPAEALRLRYPDGPHNSEALLVHPTTGDVYVVSKDGEVYKAAAPLGPSKVTTMTRIADILLGSRDGVDQVTGGDISPDGRRVALSTYADGYELEITADAAFDSIWGQPPVPVKLGSRLQGEAIAYRLDGRALLTTSEIVPSPLQQVERR